MSKQKADEFKAKGNAAYTNKQYDEAIANYTEAIKIDSKNHVYYSNRSAAYFGKGDLLNALEDGNNCIKTKKDWAKGYFRKGAALCALKRYNEAIDTFKEGLKYEPSNEDLRSNLNEAMRLKKEYKPRTNPDGSPLTPAQVAKEDGNDLFKASQYEQALQHYSRAIQLADDPQFKATVYSNRAACWVQLYNHSEVVKDCTESLNLQPNNIKALIRRALAYEALEKFEKALEDIRSVLLLDPTVEVANKAQHRIQAGLRAHNSRLNR